MTVAEVEFSCRAYEYGLGVSAKSITITKREGKVYIDGNEVKNMELDNLRLRLEVEKTLDGTKYNFAYVIYDSRHNPPKPIAEMYEALK